MSGGNDTPNTGNASRRLMQKTVAAGEARVDPSSHLRKRHTSQGESRRRFGARLPGELSCMTDAELDDRNARVWAVVLADCQRAAGVPVDSFPNLRTFGGGRSRELRRSPTVDAFRAALQICCDDYGIPKVRLADLTERTAPYVGVHVNTQSPEIDAIKAAWRDAGGPAHVKSSASARQVDVSAAVYDLLVSEAARKGVAVGVLLTRLIADSLGQ